jgi:hypothetical protein
MPALLAGRAPAGSSFPGAPGDNPSGTNPSEPKGLSKLLLPMRQRSLRVATLLFITCLLSMTDLALTMTYVKGFGMFEGNPIVLSLIGTSSPLIMVTWKLCTMAVAMIILFCQRHRWQAEFGAIVGFVVYSALMLHWQNYINEIHTHTAALTLLAHEASLGIAPGDNTAFSGGEAWVTMTE